jgi:hypothetical protein
VANALRTAFLVALLGCQTDAPGCPVSECYPAPLEAALGYWADTEGALHHDCEKMGADMLVDLRTHQEVKDYCRASDCPYGCWDPKVGGPETLAVIEHDTDSAVIERRVAHELGHLFYWCRDGDWDFEHEGPYWQALP